MNTKDFRNWVHAQVEAWRTASAPTLPTFYQNAELPQLDTVGTHWLDVRVSFVDGDEVTVGSRPRGRDVGTIKLMVYARAGEATAAQSDIVDSLREHFRVNNRYAEAKLGFPRVHSAPEALGWSKEGLLVPFKVDLP